MLRTLTLLALIGLASSATVAGAPQDARTQGQARSQAPPRSTTAQKLSDCLVEAPEKLFEVTRVVDGDTIWIDRDGELEKLRLLSIDTEEKWMGGNNLSASKPSTRFGEQSTGWAQGYFTPRHPDEAPARVGLRFPNGLEARDPYGRLLCHVVTREGIDFNLLMVRFGHSPYFNKYGNSRIDHARFEKAQAAARRERIGVWDDRTNEGGARRPYERLVPWWQARAQAVDAFRAMAEKDPLGFVSSDEPDALERAIESGPREVTVLALIDRFFEEDDGSRTVLLRSGDKRRAVRVRIPKELRPSMARLDLENRSAEYRQNYLLVSGTLQRGARGFDLRGVTLEGWRPAGPEPDLPAGR